MQISHKIYKPKKRSFIFRERELSHPNLPGIGAISGPADYLIGHSKSSKLPKGLIKANPGLAEPDDRLFVVLEAKKTETLSKDVSATQLLAQVLTLELGQL
jgi:hypothetical protein